MIVFGVIVDIILKMIAVGAVVLWMVAIIFLLDKILITLKSLQSLSRPVKRGGAGKSD